MGVPRVSYQLLMRWLRSVRTVLVWAVALSGTTLLILIAWSLHTRAGTERRLVSRKSHVNATRINNDIPPVVTPSPASRPIANEPITVTVMNTHYLGKYGGKIFGCPHPRDATQELQCDIYEHPTDEQIDAATAHWYHIPTLYSASYIEDTQHAGQKRIGFSMESAAYYPTLDDKKFMGMFDLEMSYRLSADVVTHYFPNSTQLYSAPRIPTSQKKNRIVYLQRNCGAPSRRDEIIKRLMQMGLPIDAYGSCLHNVEESASKRFDKMELFSQHKFCITMENSIAQDYVSEKLWQGFEAGCLPLYLGAPNIVEDFLPDPKSVLLVPSDPDNRRALRRFAQTIEQLMHDDALYDSRMTWRYKPWSRRSAGFQNLVRLASLPSTECQLCQKLAT